MNDKRLTADGERETVDGERRTRTDSPLGAGGWKVDKTWTLFLDRDGVINQRTPGAYIADIEEFEFIDGVLDALRFFATIFD